VYVDTDGSRTLTSRDIPINGVKIDLTCTTIFGEVVTLSTTTAGYGNYAFEGLTPGTCTVTEQQPADLGTVVENPGSKGGTAGGNRIADVTLVAGDRAIANNFGESPGELPATGSLSSTPIGLGLVFVGLGLLALAFERRRVFAAAR
jgi:large repetitive protein